MTEHSTGAASAEPHSTSVVALPDHQQHVESTLAELHQVIRTQEAMIAELCGAVARNRQGRWFKHDSTVSSWLRETKLWANLRRMVWLYRHHHLNPRSFAGCMRRLICNQWPYGHAMKKEHRVCFLGESQAGSWQMRAKQISATRPHWDAIVTNQLWPINWAKYEIVVFVKRFDHHLAETLRSQGKKVIYDIVDPWKQPEDGLKHSTQAQAVAYFQRLLANLPVDGVIFPNQTMMDDLQHLTPAPVTIYHHSRPELAPVDPRAEARVVGYEGCAEYLGPWHDVLEEICRSLNLELAINPESLNDIDIGFIARGGVHGSLMAKRYKSNVKLANMLAAGVPSVVQAGEASYVETGADLVEFFSTPEELKAAIVRLLPYETRRLAHQRMLAHSMRFSIDAIAQQYDAYFRKILTSPAAASELPTPLPARAA